MKADTRRGLVTGATVLLLFLLARLLLGVVPVAGRDYHPDERVWIAVPKES